MKSYFHKLVSIIIASLILATAASFLVFIYGYVNESLELRNVLLPYLIAWFGFLIFGIPGSLIWNYTERKLPQKISEPARHKIAVTTAILILPMLWTLLTSGLDFQMMGRAYIFLLLVFPVAYLSMTVFRRVFGAKKT